MSNAKANPSPSQTIMVSLTPDGAASGSASSPSISSDGRTVVFNTLSPLVPEDRNGAPDVYVRDVEEGTTKLVSATPEGVSGAGASTGGSLSTNGRLVAFTSTAEDLSLGDTNQQPDVFVRDLVAGTTVRVSATERGEEAAAPSGGALISDDGSAVAFWSTAALVAADTNGMTDAYVHDLVTGTIELVSVGDAGMIGDGASFPTSLSANARFVTIATRAQNLVSNDTNGSADVVMRDRTADTTIRVSLADNGAEPNGDSGMAPTVVGMTGSPAPTAEVSDDGRYVVFTSTASNLTAQDPDESSDVFLRDVESGQTTLVSEPAPGQASDGWSDSPAISGDGSMLAYRDSERDPFSPSPGVSRVVALPAAGGTSELLSILPSGHGASTAASPSLTYDGTIAALTMRDPGNEVYVRNRT